MNELENKIQVLTKQVKEHTKWLIYLTVFLFSIVLVLCLMSYKYYQNTEKLNKVNQDFHDELQQQKLNQKKIEIYQSLPVLEIKVEKPTLTETEKSTSTETEKSTSTKTEKPTTTKTEKITTVEKEKSNDSKSDNDKK
ncbi:hypothetical protein [Candidatus Phytoplasma pyri]|uniref:hypothetical protein n=1 Tax=Candidatus Phytoplasma pyri TaxID=47566 RepID=UPI003982F940